MLDELTRLVEQIREVSEELEEKKGAEVAVPWFERQMGWFGELYDGFKEAEKLIKRGE